MSLAGVTPASGPACLVAATGNGLLGISKNNGASWDTVDPGLASKSVGSLLTVGSMIYAATGDGVLVSSDGGYHWSSSSPPAFSPAGNDLSQWHAHGQPSGGVFVTSNSGATWTARNGELGSVAITGLTRGIARTFAGTAAGVFALADTAAQWIARNTGNSDGVNTVKYLNGVLYTGPGARGIYSSTNDGVAAGSSAEGRSGTFSGPSCSHSGRGNRWSWRERAERGSSGLPTGDSIGRN